jgi:hypothetical protein
MNYNNQTTPLGNFTMKPVVSCGVIKLAKTPVQDVIQTSGSSNILFSQGKFVERT